MSLARFAHASHAEGGRKSHPARRNVKSLHQLAVLSSTLSLSVFLAGCVGATRVPSKSRGPDGEALQSKKLDLAFLDTSGMQREEVVRRLGSVDTAYSNPRLFWGRWSDSKWGY